VTNNPAPTPTVADTVADLCAMLEDNRMLWDNERAVINRAITHLRNAAAMEKDAARYWWLRDPHQQIAKVIDKPGRELFDQYGRFDGYEYEYRSGEELDTAIDAQLAARDAEEQKT